MAEAKKQNFFAAIGSRISKYFREMRSELKKVVWPTPKQTVNNTVVVLIMVVIFSIVIWLFSFAAQTLISTIVTLTS